MNSYVVIFAAVIVAAHGNSLRAVNQGWGSGSPSIPALPTSVQLNLDASAAAAAAGSADASQDIVAISVGEAGWPAEIDLSAYTLAAVAQDISMTQAGSVDLTQPGPNSSSLNLVSVDNAAVGDEGVIAYVAGGDAAYLATNAADNANGVGQISAIANSYNNQING